MSRFREFLLGPWRAVLVLGVTQILAWGILFYPPVLMMPLIAAERGWSLSFAMAGFSLALLVAGSTAPTIGGWIDRYGGHMVMACGLADRRAGARAAGLCRASRRLSRGLGHPWRRDCGQSLRPGFRDARTDLRDRRAQADNLSHARRWLRIHRQLASNAALAYLHRLARNLSDLRRSAGACRRTAAFLRVAAHQGCAAACERQRARRSFRPICRQRDGVSSRRCGVRDLCVYPVRTRRASHRNVQARRHRPGDGGHASARCSDRRRSRREFANGGRWKGASYSISRDFQSR